MRVEAYYNLHKKCLSYRRPGGRVTHAQSLRLQDVTFSVQPAGRARVLLEQRKNVHAFVRGDLVSTDQYPATGEDWVRVTYSPYRWHTFVEADSGRPVSAADEVHIVGSAIYARSITDPK